jgi:hypothetical protein
MSDVEETYLEGMWDCPNCDAANKGSQMKCEGCGGVRAEDVKFYLPEGAKEITDEAELASAKAGPDWVCGYCSTSNTSAETACKQCGGPGEDGAKRKEEEYMPDSDASTDPYAAPGSDPSNAPGEGAKGGGGIPVALIAGVVVLLLISCCCLGWVFSSSTKTMEVVSTNWVRQISLQERKWVTEESVTRPFPSSTIRNVTSRRVSRTVSVKKQVPVKKTKKISLGNGRFKKQTTTVMETKTVKEKKMMLIYFYMRRKWINLKPLIARGGPTDVPAWPKRLISSIDRRESKREEYYVVTFKETKDKDAKNQLLSSQGRKNLLAPTTLEEMKTKYPVGTTWIVTYSTAKGISAIKKP